MKIKNINIGIFGLGYVGLPLAIEFGKKFNVFAYDNNKKRINDLKKNIDKNNDIKKKDFQLSKFIHFTSHLDQLKKCNVFIVAVPTPITKSKKPDLSYIKLACKNVGSLLKSKDIIIFESTVYPGLTEEVCVPILEKKSKLKFNVDFYCGYSPERINPNDTKHNIRNIVKITSGSNKETANFVDNLYKKIINAGTYKVSSIKIAEAAKVIENAQRDLNIAFVNELSIIFDKLNLDTSEILKAASTKWNFIKFQPGLVGGHCIGVDPYYLTYRSKKSGFNPRVITSGRVTNDKMSDYVINKSIKNLNKVFNNKKYKFLVLGLTFKENCSDYRNSKSIEIVEKLKNKNHQVDCFDPLIKIKDFNQKKSIKMIKKIKKQYYNCVILSVGHNYFKKIGYKKINSYLLPNGLIFDIKNILPKNKKSLYL